MMKKIFLFILFFIITTFSAKAVTFQTYDELYDCVETYNTFLEYKKNLKNCFEKKVSFQVFKFHVFLLFCTFFSR